MDFFRAVAATVSHAIELEILNPIVDLLASEYDEEVGRRCRQKCMPVEESELIEREICKQLYEKYDELAQTAVGRRIETLSYSWENGENHKDNLEIRKRILGRKFEEKQGRLYLKNIAFNHERQKDELLDENDNYDGADNNQVAVKSDHMKITKCTQQFMSETREAFDERGDRAARLATKTATFQDAAISYKERTAALRDHLKEKEKRWRLF